MRQLTADERFLLVAREVDGIDFEELAKIIGESSGTLRTRLHRLKERIRESFSKEVTLKEVV
jgi:RNA polymerase sigma-70 factor (ECF subfamily)